MSDENDRCPECNDDGWTIGVGGIGGTHACKECKGTGPTGARDGVTCTALVGCSAECEVHKALADVVKAWKSGGGFALVQACESAEKVMDARNDQSHRIHAQ
jgi:hypothetical protein